MALSKITTASLSDNAVTTAKITDANITTAKIADTAITTAKITDANITTAKIADANITTAKVADDAVTNAKIGAGAITNTEVNASASIDRGKFATPLCVYAGSTVDNGGFAAGAWEGIPFATEIVDTNNAFVGEASTNTNNAGIFTAPFAGKFILVAGQCFKTTTTSNLANGQIRIVKNTTGDATDGGTAIAGTEVGITVANSVSTQLSATTSAVLDLSSGDKIWCEAYANWWGGAWRAGDGFFSLMQIG
tara:strand:- start:2216 stop:2965 length:750 start_codon:yes stop_codon:yes gene_type:complete